MRFLFKYFLHNEHLREVRRRRRRRKN